MHALACPLCRIALPTVDDVCPRDGRVGVEAAWLAVPTTLSQRFRVLEPFAHGATGSLYLADEPETGRRGLLKILAPVLKEQAAERQRLRRELVKQATLQRSHLIVPLASGESEGATWMFREWLDGVSLEVRLSREGSLQQTEALAIAAQIATALDELHRGGLLHRDVKPGHIFLQPTAHGIPRAFLLDAGVAAGLQTAGGSKLQGTAGYLAPEQLLGGLVSFRSDLYSLGCVLYRMLSGRPAFAGETLEETLLLQRRAELPPIRATLPNGIGTLLQSILSKDPQERPFSAQKLRRTLDPFLPDGALMEKQPTPTSTFETLPQPRPSTAPQASGTLRPPPPPAVRPSTPAAVAGGTLKPPASPDAPAAPGSAKPAVQERTQQIDLDQIDLEEVLPAPRRITSKPPPMPREATSSLPPARRKPVPLSEKTQPIRLDQILAVAASRKSAEPPPAAPEAVQPSLPPPAPVPAIAPALESLFASPDAELTPAPGALDHESFSETPAHKRASQAAAKATLMGIGGDPLEQSAPLEVVATAAAAARGERDHPTERISRTGGDPDSGDISQAVTGSMPAHTLNTLGGLRADSRRLLMYASAALVGLGVLGVGASSLFGGDPVRVEQRAAPAALPVAAALPRAAEPAAQAPALAEAPRPAVEPLSPERAATPAPATLPIARAVEAEPQAPAAVAHKHTSEPAEAKEPVSSRHKSRDRERAAAKAATKVVQAEKSADKATLFAEARDQARAHYTAKRFKDAAVAYERATRLDPANSGAFAGLGAARLAVGDNAGALQAYKRAVQLAPDKSGFHAALGRAYLANGDKSRAVAAYKKAVTLDPANGAAKSALAQLGS